VKFGIFLEAATPRPWDDRSEKRIFDEALEQVELADRLGFGNVWVTEHHFMEEYAHMASPEVFLAAASQRTKNIRLGHGVRHSPPKYNHPAKLAECCATLDILSNGRVDFGTGDSGSEIELSGFGVDPNLKREMALEALEQVANMMAMDPYPGFEGKHFSMPARNVVPKPLQKPHPPLWLACSARPTIKTAAQTGLGVVCFSFLEAADAKAWIDEYYELLRTECRPIGHTVNPNFALFTGFGVHQDAQVAADRFLDGVRFFQFAINWYYKGNVHIPGRTNIWELYEKNKTDLISTEDDENLSRQLANSKSAIGDIPMVRQRLRDLRDAGVDQVNFIMQHGRTKHEHICESLELFAKEIMPEFAEEHDAIEAKKAKALAPFIEKAFERIGGYRPLTVPDDQIRPVDGKNFTMKYGKETVLGMKAADAGSKEPAPAV
jgi:alkanesulfonate monooxygenase SsuD/methylene tetrahydromethanopterin reductase-like flavin-dependent oxidoreductase (luciferase family)